MSTTKEEYDRFYRKDWMTDEQYAAYCFMADVVGGFHHLQGKPKRCGMGIEINLPDQRRAMFDFDRLTRLVLMAHERCFRVDVMSSGPGRLRFIVNKRAREGAIHERHPTIEQAIEGHRKSKA